MKMWVDRSRRRFMNKDHLELLKGTLDILILKTLTRGPMHGYGVALQIQLFSDDLLQVEEGSLYPALYRMEKRGLIESKWDVSDNNRRAKYYKLTRAGRRYLLSETSNWVQMSKAISRILGVG
jgi:PadR family transcriptional regulator